MKALSPLVVLALGLFVNIASAHAETLQVDLYADRPEGSGHTSYYVSGYTDVNTGAWGVYMDIVKYNSDDWATEFWRCEGPGLAFGVTPEVGYARIYRDDSQPAPLCYDFYSGRQVQLYDWYIDFLRGPKIWDDPWFTQYQMSADGYIRFGNVIASFDTNGTDYEAFGYVLR
jgi:hypothetical protein